MILEGNAVSEKISAENIERVNALKDKGIIPTLAIFRIGEKGADLSYEKGLSKRCKKTGVEIQNFVFDEDVEVETFQKALEKANNDDSIHGILVFQPLPKRFGKNWLELRIDPEKDVDGCSLLSLAGLFANEKVGFAPCTAEAAVEMLDHYGIEISGKNVVVLGRSLVIGKPVTMLLMNKDATVTVCHRKTKDTAKIASGADILICAIGEAEAIDKSYVNEKQTIIDVGINYVAEKQKLCGDVLYDEVAPLVENISPVPGGVGSVTTAILIRHVIEAAER